MPICSIGGAKCCAGDSATVRAHEIEVHGKRPGGGNRPAQSSYITITHAERTEADDLLKQNAARRRTARVTGHTRTTTAVGKAQKAIRRREVK